MFAFVVQVAAKRFCVCEGPICESICDDYHIITGQEIDTVIQQPATGKDACLYITRSEAHIPECTSIIFSLNIIMIMSLTGSQERIQINFDDDEVFGSSDLSIQLQNVDVIWAKKLYSTDISLVLNASLMSCSYSTWRPDTGISLRANIESIRLWESPTYLPLKPFLGVVQKLSTKTNATKFAFNGPGVELDDVMYTFDLNTAVNLLPTAPEVAFYQKARQTCAVLITTNNAITITFADYVYDIPSMRISVGNNTVLRSADGVSPVPDVEVFDAKNRTTYIPHRQTHTDLCFTANRALTCGDANMQVVPFNNREDMTKYLIGLDRVNIKIASGDPFIDISRIDAKTVSIRSDLPFSRPTVYLSKYSTLLDLDLENLIIAVAPDFIIHCHSIVMKNVENNLKLNCNSIVCDSDSLPSLVTAKTAKINGAVRDINFIESKVTLNSVCTIKADATELTLTKSEVNMKFSDPLWHINFILLQFEASDVHLDVEFEQVNDEEASKIEITYTENLTISTLQTKIPAFTIDSEGKMPPKIQVMKKPTSSNVDVGFIVCAVFAGIFFVALIVAIVIIIKQKRARTAVFNFIP